MAEWRGMPSVFISDSHHDSPPQQLGTRVRRRRNAYRKVGTSGGGSKDSAGAGQTRLRTRENFARNLRIETWANADRWRGRLVVGGWSFSSKAEEYFLSWQNERQEQLERQIPAPLLPAPSSSCWSLVRTGRPCPHSPIG